MAILLIDDEEWNITKLHTILGARHVHVDYASMLEDALGLARETKYEGIVVDFNMDRLNGSQLLQLLKGDFEGSYVREDICSLQEIMNYDPEIGEVIEENFEDFSDYCAFVDRFSGVSFALFSAHSQFGDAYIPDEVYVGQKNNDDASDYTAETRILEHLEAEGALRAR
jgi:CheY-like chemotaxis protein